ncbi:alpha/beta fold hydrolase [Modestobacter sp. SYSU DS0657]
MIVSARNDVRVTGPDDGRPIVFLHGYGCNQDMWRFLVPEFATDHRVVTLDLVGFGDSDADAWDPERHGSLAGHAADVVAVCRDLGLSDVVLVGHSVSAMIAVLVHQQAPELVGALVLVGPNPRYVDDGDYTGGFSRTEIAELLDTLDGNHTGWSTAMGPVIMGNPERPELAAELTASFCRTDPEVARLFARVTFLSDNRADLPGVTVPTLVLQCSEDVIAPEVVGRYVHAAIPGSVFTQLAATGHCPHLSAPEETIAAIRSFLTPAPAH